MDIAAVQELVNDYLTVFPDEAEELRLLQERLKRDEQFNHRKSFGGHGTGAAIVLSPDHTKVLLIHHKGLGKWMQPGGHWDPEDPNPWTVAQREAEEETGVTMAEALHVDVDRPHIPLDIESHHIPANPAKDEPEHYHHDMRYAFVAKDEKLTPQKAEVLEAVWIPVNSEDDRLTHIWGCLAKLRQFDFIT
ncbi:MAG: NUDIX hydrolase [Candidatus Saccharibacteria bacterium]